MRLEKFKILPTIYLWDEKQKLSLWWMPLSLMTCLWVRWPSLPHKAREPGGNTWTDPIRVNDDPDNSTADQFFPWVAVSPLGDIHIVYYDKRDDPNNYLLDIYYTHSKNGTFFDKNWKITTNSSDPSYSYHQSGNVFIGDYIGIDASESNAYAIWTDTRKGEADAYTAVIVGDTGS